MGKLLRRQKKRQVSHVETHCPFFVLQKMLYPSNAVTAWKARPFVRLVPQEGGRNSPIGYLFCHVDHVFGYPFSSHSIQSIAGWLPRREARTRHLRSSAPRG